MKNLIIVIVGIFAVISITYASPSEGGSEAIFSDPQVRFQELPIALVESKPYHKDDISHDAIIECQTKVARTEQRLREVGMLIVNVLPCERRAFDPIHSEYVVERGGIQFLRK